MQFQSVMSNQEQSIQGKNAEGTGLGLGLWLWSGLRTWSLVCCSSFSARFRSLAVERMSGRNNYASGRNKLLKNGCCNSIGICCRVRSIGAIVRKLARGRLCFWRPQRNSLQWWSQSFEDGTARPLLPRLLGRTHEQRAEPQVLSPGHCADVQVSELCYSRTGALRIPCSERPMPRGGFPSLPVALPSVLQRGRGAVVVVRCHAVRAAQRPHRSGEWLKCRYCNAYVIVTTAITSFHIVWHKQTRVLYIKSSVRYLLHS